MNAHQTFESVYVGVNIDESETESDPYFNGLGPLRKGCIECGGCMVGCRENAKNTLDRNYLWFAEKHGSGDPCLKQKLKKSHIRDNLYHIETKSITSFFGNERRVFSPKELLWLQGHLGHLNFCLNKNINTTPLPLLSDKLGHELRTNAETLCAVSGASEKLNNGLAITSVFSPDPITHVEIVKYPDKSNAMKWFFGLSVGGSETSHCQELEAAC